jgi:hypothetical protein
MKHKEFVKLLNSRIAKIQKVMASKNREYANDNDKLHNFKRAGKMLNCSPEKALVGMWSKHIISILDIIDELEFKCGANQNCFPDFVPEAYMKMIDEKICDAINYLILLEALITERYNEVIDG